MVVPINPCHRRGGLWWRMDARAAGEENRGEGENRGRWRRNAGKGEEGKGIGFLEDSEAGVGNAGFYKMPKPALVVPALKFFKKQKPPLGMPALSPTTKRTTLVKFFKLDVEFGFFFFSVNYIRTKLSGSTVFSMFARVLYKTLHRAIGLKSTTLSGMTFFGIRTK